MRPANGRILSFANDRSGHQRFVEPAPTAAVTRAGIVGRLTDRDASRSWAFELGREAVLDVPRRRLCGHRGNLRDR